MSEAGERRLQLYVRRGCTLCEDMASDLDSFSGELGFSIERIDIDRDPELRKRFDVLVPVLMFRQQEICRYFLDTVALRSALAPE